MSKQRCFALLPALNLNLLFPSAANPSQTAIAKFNSELAMLKENLLDHPNVVSLLGVCTLVRLGLC